MTYYAHSTENTDKSDWQKLDKHLIETADLVALYSKEFCEEAFAKNIGLLHDIGKYQNSFQKRLEGDKTPVEHSIFGAMEWLENQFPEFGAYCIAGHHGGLLDIGTISDTEYDSSLKGRLKRGKNLKADYSHYKSEITLTEIPTNKLITKNAIAASPTNNMEIFQKEFAFWTRMMFSCLVDADYINTEMFYNKTNNENHNKIDFNEMLDKLQKEIDKFPEDTDIKFIRNQFRKKALAHIKNQNDIYFFNIPTGAGKTLISMEFALNRAIHSKKDKIIYVIPFTSIIEQNAKVFKDILGEENILEHHSNFDINSIDSITTQIKEKLMKSTENWSADIIVTTNVQFFESIYSNKNSKLRKLHNITNSVIVFDEIHMLPNKFFQPCLEAIKILTQRYNCEAIFMSATMPNFNRWLEEFQCGGMKTLDLIQDKSLFYKFKRCKIENLGQKSIDFMLNKIIEGENALIVVNKKMTARVLYNKLKETDYTVYHLSTYMTHYDREKTIAKVRNSLDNNEEFYLISTSLIEAGVDLDFDVVFRELAGLENLLQTVGRCNREGKKDSAISYSFSFEEDEFSMKNNDIKIKQSFTENVFEKFEDITSEEAINYYFDKLYEYWKNDMDIMNFSKAISSNCCNNMGFGYDFKSYGEQFKFIDDNTISVIIKPTYSVQDIKIFNSLEKLDYINKDIKRKLQKYSVSLREYEFENLQNQGVIGEVNGLFFLIDADYYNDNIGIVFEDEQDIYYC